MKSRIPYVICLVTILLFSSCEESIEPIELVNTWGLVATLYDPGDGSGQFQAIESTATLKLFEDGTFETNAFGCLLAADGRIFDGTYSLNDSSLTIDDCEHSLSFELSEEFLIVNLFCIEPCRLKFKMIE